MELLYIWIEEYKNIKKQGFNFSPKHHFEFIPEYKDENPENEIIRGELTHKEKDYNLPDDFFGNNIVNVTGVVGKNGAGKTNLLKYIFAEIIKNRKKQHIIIFKDLKTKKINISLTESFKIKNIDHLNIIENYKTACIFYSNSFNPFYFDTLKPYEIKEDVSLDFMLNDKLRTNVNFKKDTLSAINEYWLDNLMEINNFLNENLSQEILKLVSNNIGIKNIHINTQFNYFNIEQIFRNNHFFKSSFKNIFNGEISNNDNHKQLLLNLSFLFILLIIKYESDSLSININIKEEKFSQFAVLYTMYKKNEYTKQTEEYIEKDKKTSRKNDLKKYFELIKDVFQLFNKDEPIKITLINLKKILRYNNSKFESFLKIIEFIENVDPNKITYKDISGFHLMFELPRECLKKLIPIYKKTLTYDKVKQENYFEFKWRLSSGELAFLNLFSRLLIAKESSDKMMEINEKHINKKITTNRIEFDTYLILLDEIDLYLHPSWSQKNIYLLKKVLPLIFNKQVQLIITAHSPFIVSDLPKENILFLDKDEYCNCKVVPGIEQKETFGANIHTLFTSSFFMQDGLMGEFAKEKIQDVIDYLNDNNDNEAVDRIKKTAILNNKSEIQIVEQIINIIGEPILKNQIQKMLNNKRLKKVGEIDVLKKQMRFLKSKISKLENDKK